MLCSWKQTRNKQHRNKVGWGNSAVKSWGKKVVDAALERVEMPQSVSTPPVSFPHLSHPKLFTSHQGPPCYLSHSLSLDHSAATVLGANLSPMPLAEQQGRKGAGWTQWSPFHHRGGEWCRVSSDADQGNPEHHKGSRLKGEFASGR